MTDVEKGQQIQGGTMTGKVEAGGLRVSKFRT